jgi:hypothetical protein
LRKGDLVRAEQWLSEAERRLPQHAGIQENLRMLRAKQALEAKRA